VVGFGIVTRILLRKILRWARWPAGVLLALNLEKLAQDNRLDALLSNYWGAIVSSVIAALQSAWIQYPAALVLGAAIGLWVDGWLRRKEIKEDEPAQAPAEVKLSMSPTYESNGVLKNYSSTVLFLTHATEVAVCLDYRVKTQPQPKWGAWTRVTLITRPIIAKGEQIHQTIFTLSMDEKKRVGLNIESENTLRGNKRQILKDYYAECVIVVFYRIDNSARKEFRKKFVIECPIFPLNLWPQITPEISLRFEGMD
jgi:hypothetical protein